MGLLNKIIIIFISLLSGFISVFFIGTKEAFQALYNDLPKSFFIRFSISLTCGLVMLLLLTFINWTLNKNLLKNYPVNLNKLVAFGLIAISLTCLTGCLLFFFHK